jgi:acetoin utilization deacetylase AcuC-like enzyme
MTHTAYTIVASPQHTFPGHPENPSRFEHFRRLEGLPFAPQLERMDPEAVPDGLLEIVHPRSYLTLIEHASRQGPQFIDYGDTYVTPVSFIAAKEAVGGLIAVVQSVIDGYAKNGFALVRPPGHHATQDRAMGFCLFNNIAIAARYLQQQGLTRVMIVDFDVHHGNGTQDIFLHEPDLLFISTHQWGIYPGTGQIQETGEGTGAGTTINIPLPAGAGDIAFGQILERVISPAAARFSPDIMLVSAGFDAHWSDPLASLCLSTGGYFQLAKGLMEIASEQCNGRVVFTLEGGYDPEALTDNVIAVFWALAGLSMPDDRMGPSPHREVGIDPVIESVVETHALGG